MSDTGGGEGVADVEQSVLRAALLRLPSEVADELVDERQAVLSYSTRGVGEVVEIVITGIGAAESVISIVEAPAKVRLVTERIIRWAHGRKAGQDDRADRADESDDDGRQVEVTFVSRYSGESVKVIEDIVPEDVVEQICALLERARVARLPAD